jgi:predicted ester cyclase
LTLENLINLGLNERVMQNKIKIILLFMLSVNMVMAQTTSNREIVKQFLEQVRSGKYPERAFLFMAETVSAHQMNSENQAIVKRTPQNYADHIREFLKMYGNYSFEITELLADGDKVYVRWLQVGKHLAEVDGYAPTGKPLMEIASCVYRLAGGKIVEYWVQADRLGFEKQLELNKTKEP